MFTGSESQPSTSPLSERNTARSERRSSSVTYEIWMVQMGVNRGERYVITV